MNDHQELPEATPSDDIFAHLTPPTSRVPEVLAKAIERRVEGLGTMSLVELTEWLGESYRGDGRITDPHDRNIVLWTNVCQEIVDAMNILIKDGRIELRATSPLIYAMDGEVLRLPVAKRPPAAGYVHPHWQPTVFAVPPGPR